MWPTLQQPWYFKPNDVAINSKGNVYVADSSNDQVAKLSADGYFISKWGTPGTAAGQFNTPVGIAIDSEDNVYVTELWTHRVQKFTENGHPLDTWGTPGSGPGELWFPGGIAFDADELVYIAEQWNHRVQVLTKQGGYVWQWGNEGSGDGQFYRPMDVAIFGSESVYVADMGNDRIQKFTPLGDFVLAWGSEGSDPGQFKNPQGVIVDDDGIVYVIDSGNSRVQKFSQDGVFLAEWASWGTGPGQLWAPRGATVDDDGVVYIADNNNGGIHRFTVGGEFLGRWCSFGTDPGQFHWPLGIALDSAGDLYVVEQGNHRVQKLAPDGQPLLSWGTYGSELGQFDQPHGIALDSSGDVYVVDTRNDRVQKFTPEGLPLLAWGTYGTGQGQFDYPYDITVDVDRDGLEEDVVYVADHDNDRIQVFTTQGEFLREWGSSGTGDGQFDCPIGVATDGSGWVYVADQDNDRIQRFTRQGVFSLEWGSQGSGPGQFATGPRNLTVDDYGMVYVADTGGNRIQKFTADGAFVTEWGSPDVYFWPEGVTIAPDGTAFVTDNEYHRIQKFVPVVITENCKAVIVAGLQDEGDSLWDDTRMCTNFTYRALAHQGFTKDSIYYLSSDLLLDLDNNGVADDVDADSTTANLQNALETWAPAPLDGLPTSDVVVYLCDHGGPGTFWMAPTDILDESSLSSWLDTLQAGITGTLTVVVDSCESGSLMDGLAVPGRIVLTSTSPDEPATFLTEGTISFSNYFWTQIFNGLPIGDAFDAARGAMDNYQTAMLDDTGNGIGNEPGDGIVAAATYIGNGTQQWWEGPVTGAVSAPQAIDGTATATLWADPVTDADGVARVWAVIQPPGFENTSSGNALLALASVDLMPAGSDRYEASYSGFTTEGEYSVYIYARDATGNTSEPQVTSVTVTNPLTRKVLIVAGAQTINGVTLDARWPATEYNAGVAYNALKFQGYGDADIQFLSHTTTAGVDGLATWDNIEWAINSWAASNTQDFTLYLVGYGENGAFVIHDAERLTVTQLDTWLDDLQATLPGKVTVVNDTDQAATFLPYLLPPAGKQRIVIASTQTNQTAQFLVGGGISFSNYFWSSVANGATTLWAFWRASEAMAFAQTAAMDDNADGVYNTKADGAIAISYLLGSGIVLAGSAPVIGTAAPDATLSGSPTCTLWAEQVTTAGSIQAVHAVIYPPYHENTRTMLPQTILPTVSLSLAGTGDRRYEGTWDGFWALGDYRVNIYAIDDQDNVSIPVSMTVHQTAGLGDGDTDGDGIPDNVEGPGDIDGDGQLNYADLDSDGDSLLDADEFHEDPDWDDLDGDGLLNCYDTDSDGDGLADDYETATGTDPYDPDDPPATPIHLKTIALILLLLSAPLALLRLHRPIPARRPSNPVP